MAVTRIETLRSAKKGNPSAHLKNLVEYIQREKKTEGGKLVGSRNCDIPVAYQQMMDTKQFYGKTDKTQGFHIIISFSPEEADAETAMDIISRFVDVFINEQYECVYAVHTDRSHIHGHIVYNSVSCLDGKKYHYAKGDWARIMQPLTNQLCAEYGLETIDIHEPGTRQYNHYGEWMEGQEKRTTPLVHMKSDLDAAILSADTMDELVANLSKKYVVRMGKETMSLKLPDSGKATRTSRLGYAYTVAAIRQRLAGGKIELEHYSQQTEDFYPVQMHRAGYRIAGKAGVNNKNQYGRYRSDVAELLRMQRAEQYMTKHGIKTSSQLDSRIQHLSLTIASIDEERKRIFKSRRQHKDAIQLLRTHGNDDQVLAEIRRLGYDPDQLLRFDRESSGKLEELRRMKKAAGYEIKICREIQPSELKRTR